MRFLSIYCLILWWSNFSLFAIDTAQNGNWNSSNTWVGGNVPNPSDDVRILHEVRIPGQNRTVNNLEITSSGILDAFNGGITVTGTFTLSGTFLDTNNGGVNTFVGNITVTNSGRFEPVSNSNFIFQGNITNQGTFNHSGGGTITFNGTSPKTILPTQSMIFGGSALNIQKNLTVLNGQSIDFNSNTTEVSAGFVLLNQNAVGLKLGNSLTGTGTFENGENAYASYAGSAAPTLLLNTSALNNTFAYISTNNQNIKAGTYYHLNLQNTATPNREKILSGNITVSGNLHLLEGLLTGKIVFNPAGFDLRVEGQTFLENKTLWEDNNAAGTSTFVGQMSLETGAILRPSSASNFTFEGGISNQGTFEILNGGNILFEGANQIINPTQSIQINGNIIIAQQLTIQNGNEVGFLGIVTLQTNSTLTNQNPQLVFGNNLIGNTEAMLINAINANIFYRGQDAPLSSGQANLSAIGNRFIYDRAGNQEVAPFTYQNLRLAGSGDKTLFGNVTITGNLEIISNLIPNQKRIIFSGNQDQDIDISAVTETFYEIELNKSAGTLSSNKKVEIEKEMIFTQGFWTSSDINPLLFLNNSTTSGASATGHVNGPVSKAGTQDFIFPIGNAGVFAPLGIANLTGNDTFTTAYTRVAHPESDETSLDVAFISEVEYWNLKKVNSTTQAKVSLFWQNGTTSGIQDLTDLTIVRWTGSEWENIASAAQGNTTIGQIQSDETLATLGDFTFASLDARNSLGNTNIIPPTPILESVVPDFNGKVQLTWQDLAYQETQYIVERATGSNPNFMNYAELPKNTTDFEDDNVTQGETYYYQIRASNPFGRSEPSNRLGALIAIVSALPPSFLNIPKVYPNPSHGEFYLENVSDILNIYDMQGKSIPFQVKQEATRNSVEIQGIRVGTYFLSLKNGLVLKIILE